MTTPSPIIRNIADILIEYNEYITNKFEKLDARIQNTEIAVQNLDTGHPNPSASIDQCRKRIVALEETIRQLTTIPVAPPISTVTEEKKDDSLDKLDVSDMTQLMHAVSSGDVELIESLCSKGANVNTQDGRERTALYFIDYLCPTERMWKIIVLLKENGADLEHEDVRGMSALAHYASFGSNYHQTAVEMLLQVGANRHVRDNSNHGVFYHAHQAKSAGIMKLLLEYGVTYFD